MHVCIRVKHEPKELETIVSSVEFDQASASLSKEDLSVLEDNSNGTQHSSFSSLAMPPCHAGGKDTREHSVSKVWQRLELGVLVAAILVVWGLFIPTSRVLPPAN